MTGVKIKDLDAVVDISSSLEFPNTDGASTTKITLGQMLEFVKTHMLDGWPQDIDTLDELKDLIEDKLVNKKVFRTRTDLSTALGTSGYFDVGDIALADGVHYYYDGSSTSIPDLVGFIPVGQVSSKHFGATGDGVTDDTSALQNMLNYSSATVYIPAGNYKLTQKLDLNSDKVVFGDGPATKILTDGITSGLRVFDIHGSGATLIEANSSAISSKQRTYTFSNSSHGLEVGDIIAVRHNTNGSYNPARTYYNKGEFMRVKNVDGATVQFTSGFYDDYLASSSSLYKMGMINVSVENLNFEGSPDNHAEYVIDFKAVRDARIHNVQCIDAGNYGGIAMTHCYNISVMSCMAIISEYGNLANNAYPILISNSQDIRLNDVHAASPWHAIAVGGGSAVPNIVNRGIIVSNSHMESYTGIFPADFHGNVEHSGYYNCTMRGAGATMGANHNQFIGNRVITVIETDGDARTSDLCFYTSEAIGVGFVISNNTVEIPGWYPYSGFGQFVEILQMAPSGQPSSLIISDNEVVLTGETNTGHSNLIINVRGVGTNDGGDGIGDVDECMVSITGNSIYSKFSPVHVDNVIRVWSGSSNTTDNFKAITIANNTLNGVGINVIGGGAVNVSGNNVSGAYYGLTINRAEVLNVTGNIFRDCRHQGLNVTGVYDSAIIQGNSLIENLAGNLTSGGDDCEMFFTDLAIAGNGGGHIISGNVLKCRTTTSYMMTLDSVRGLMEKDNIFIGDPAVRQVNIINTGMPEIAHKSSIHERDFTLVGTTQTDVCVITFNNGSWGAVSFECDLVMHSGVDYIGNFKARMRGHATIDPAIMDNTSFTSVTDPTTGTTPPLIFTISTNTITVSVQGINATEVSRFNMKAFKAARAGDMDDLKIDWKV